MGKISFRRDRDERIETTGTVLVKGGQAAAVTAKILGIPKQTLENWVRLHGKGQLNDYLQSDAKPGVATTG
jgi:transposase-like protein